MRVTAENLGPQVPRRGNAFTQWLGLLWLRLIGWQITGQSPDVPRAVFIGAPHTSNRDGFVAAAVTLALRLNITVMAKAELFIGPLGPFFRWLGVRPVYRDRNMGLVEQSVAQLKASPALYLGIAPEGTRHASKAWKLGFYHIAVQADVPIIAFILDFGRKELRMTPAFYPTGDMDADIAALMQRYRGIVPADPSRLSLPLRDLNQR